MLGSSLVAAQLAAPPDGLSCMSEWSQGLRGLRHESSSPPATVGSWVRITLEAWISVCVFVVLCVGISLATGWSPSKDSYLLCIWLRNWKGGQSPRKGCRERERERAYFILLCRIEYKLNNMISCTSITSQWAVAQGPDEKAILVMYVLYYWPPLDVCRGMNVSLLRTSYNIVQTFEFLPYS